MRMSFLDLETILFFMAQLYRYWKQQSRNIEYIKAIIEHMISKHMHLFTKKYIHKLEFWAYARLLSRSRVS